MEPIVVTITTAEVEDHQLVLPLLELMDPHQMEERHLQVGVTEEMEELVQTVMVCQVQYLEEVEVELEQGLLAPRQEALVQTAK